MDKILTEAQREIMSTKNRLSMGILLAVGLVAAGCGESEHRHANQSPLSGGGPTLHPNTVRYRNAGVQPATGRSGTASITVTTLMSSDGSTDIEVSTGGEGVLAHVQIKILDGSGGLLATDNYSVNTGDAHFTYTNLARGQPISVLASVRDLDGNRTDVVTGVTRVARRPDLAVTRLDAPASALVNTNVSIAATVAELNGDVGATADCVLSVDGAEADRSTGIWVDAGSSVTCRFIHSFATTGTHSLRVTAANVTPADWDLSNNSMDGSIDITSGGGSSSMRYQVTASETAHAYVHHIDAWATYPAPMPDLVVDETQNDWSQSRTFNASIQGAVQFPLTAFDLADSTSGTPLLAMHADNIDASSTWGTPASGGACAYVYADEAFASICSQWDGGGSSTSISAFRDAGDVSYHSEGYERYWGWYFAPNMTFNGGYWVWNSTTDTPMGPQIHLGSTYTVDATLEAGNTWSAHASFPLGAFSGSQSQPYTCAPFMTSGQWCESWTYNTSGVAGNASN
jgi:hypothetical protein